MAVDAVAVGPQGNIAITGHAAADVVFEPAATTEVETAHRGGGDLFVAKLNPDGGFLWAAAIAGDLNDWFGGVTFGSDGAVYGYDDVLVGSKVFYNVGGDFTGYADFIQFPRESAVQRYSAGRHHGRYGRRWRSRHPQLRSRWPQGDLVREHAHRRAFAAGRRDSSARRHGVANGHGHGFDDWGNHDHERHQHHYWHKQYDTSTSNTTSTSTGGTSTSTTSTNSSTTTMSVTGTTTTGTTTSTSTETDTTTTTPTQPPTNTGSSTALDDGREIPTERKRCSHTVPNPWFPMMVAVLLLGRRQD